MARVQGRAALPILWEVFGSIGAVALITSAVLSGVRASQINGFQHAEGTVVAQTAKGRGFSPVVEFSTPGGAKVLYTPELSTKPPRYTIGEHLPVLYSPSDPSHALIDKFWELWFLPLFPILFGVIFGSIGLGLFIASRRKPAIVGNTASLTIADRTGHSLEERGSVHAPRR